MGSFRGLRTVSAAAALVIASAPAGALANHKRTYVPVYAAQAPVTYAAPAAAPVVYAAPAPTAYYTQAPAAAPVQTTYAAPAPAPVPVQVTYAAPAPAPIPVTYTAAAPVAVAPAAGAPTDGGGTLSPTLRAALVADLRREYRQPSSSLESGASTSDRIAALREKGAEFYKKLSGNPDDLTGDQQAELSHYVDYVVAEALNRPASAPSASPVGQMGYPYGVQAAPFAGAYPAYYAAPALFLVQPVTPVQLLAPVQYPHHHLLHPHKN